MKKDKKSYSDLVKKLLNQSQKDLQIQNNLGQTYLGQTIDSAQYKLQNQMSLLETFRTQQLKATSRSRSRETDPDKPNFTKNAY